MRVEGDSNFFIETIKGNMWEGWGIKHVIDDIKYLLATLNRFDLNHIFWEGNSAANGMAVIGLA